MTPWRNDPRLKTRFHPDFPDDIQVIVHDINEQSKWIIEPCQKCGLTELFDEPSELIKITFPDLHVPDGKPVMITFNTFCGATNNTLNKRLNMRY